MVFQLRVDQATHNRRLKDTKVAKMLKIFLIFLDSGFRHTRLNYFSILELRIWEKASTPAALPSFVFRFAKMRLSSTFPLSRNENQHQPRRLSTV